MTAQERKAMHIINDAKGHALAGNATERQILICVTYIEEFNKIKDEYKAAIAVCKDLGLFEKECPPELEQEIREFEQEYDSLLQMRNFRVNIACDVGVQWDGVDVGDNGVCVHFNQDIYGISDVKRTNDCRHYQTAIKSFVEKAEAWGRKHFNDEKWLWGNCFE